VKRIISLLLLSFFISTVWMTAACQAEELQEYQEYKSKYTTLKGGCLITRSRDDLAFALRMLKEGWGTKVARKVKRGELDLTKEGDKVYVADVDPKNGIAKVMPEGNPAVFWTETKALGNEYSNDPSVDYYKMKTK